MLKNIDLARSEEEGLLGSCHIYNGREAKQAAVLDSHVFFGGLPPVLCNADLAFEQAELVVEVVQGLSIWLLQQLRVIVTTGPDSAQTAGCQATDLLR